jgi:hypothetical protein
LLSASEMALLKVVQMDFSFDAELFPPPQPARSGKARTGKKNVKTNLVGGIFICAPLEGDTSNVHS